MFDHSKHHGYGQNQFHKMHYQSHHYFQNNSIRSQKMPQGKPFYENLNYEHWCETCDKGFKTLSQLEVHRQQHQKCNIDGCQFVAHPKVITKHIQMQHSTGLYKKIANLNNPEEIKKWREERKRKYPTKENVEKKAAEIKEKIERGEKMGLRLNNKRKNNNADVDSNGINPHKKFKSTNNESSNKRNKNFKRERLAKFKNTNKLIEVPEETRKLKPFEGIQSLILENDEELPENEESLDLIEADEYIQDKPIVQDTNTKPQLCGALSSLICDYQSSGEENEPESASVETVNSCSRKNDNNKQHETKTIKTINKIVNNACDKKDKKGHKENLVLKHQISDSKDEATIANEIDSDSGPEEVEVKKENDKDKLTEVKIVPKSVNFKSNRERQNKIANKKDKFNTKDRNLRRKLPSTLLEKLLHKEILQERNIVLQCIKHIVNNNFFE